MKAFLPLLFLLLAGLVTPGQARDTAAQPWEMLGDMLRKGRPPIDARRPPAPISKLESADLWDAFLTQVVKRSAGEARDGGQRQEFLFVLLSGRHDGVALLAREAAVPDPLRELFLLSWDRLAPLIRDLSREADAQVARQFQAFLKAGDALEAAQRLGDALGVRITPDALRELARLLLSEKAGDPLAYDLALDPELRSLFGFGSPLPPAERSRLLGASGLPWPIDPRGWLLPAAFAATLSLAAPFDPETAALARRLNNWLPTSSDLNAYLPEMHSLLQRTAEATLNQRASEGHALADEYHTLYRNLVLATAWQESCWRQFVRRKGKVQVIQSGVGAVGLMQVYPRVWRGFYDVAGLQSDVGYNGRAGAEILHHYLRDYAIARSDHSGGSDPDDLARGTYSVYNGGPGHLMRHRKPQQRADLRDIDASFLEKYEAVKAGKALEVGRCFAATERPG